MPAAARLSAIRALGFGRPFSAKDTNTMRKLIVLLTLTVSMFAAVGALNAGGSPPECNPCPWVR
jgi:hypothetical protein